MPTKERNHVKRNPEREQRGNETGIQNEDADAGGGPETDREKNRRKSFIELYDNELSSGSAESTQPTTGTMSG